MFRKQSPKRVTTTLYLETLDSIVQTMTTVEEGFDYHTAARVLHDVCYPKAAETGGPDIIAIAEFALKNKTKKTLRDNPYHQVFHPLFQAYHDVVPTRPLAGQANDGIRHERCEALMEVSYDWFREQKKTLTALSRPQPVDAMPLVFG